MRSVVGGLLLGSAFVFQASASAAGGFTLTSTAFKDGDAIPMSVVYDKMGCKGGDHSPQLSWTGAPAGTKSFAVTIYDPDAKTGSGWWHWTVFNIPASVDHLDTDAGAESGKGLPKGAVQGRTDFGFSHFAGPCPPETDGPHRYHFTVYALKVDKLPGDVDKDASGAMVGMYLQKDMLGQAEIVGVSDGKKDHK
jgi:Raf kinase inhibitor-like YbhB/YbcL family protein